LFFYFFFRPVLSRPPTSKKTLLSSFGVFFGTLYKGETKRREERKKRTKPAGKGEKERESTPWWEREKKK